MEPPRKEGWKGVSGQGQAVPPVAGGWEVGARESQLAWGQDRVQEPLGNAGNIR